MEEKKLKKPIFKKWWFWLLIVVIIFAIGNAGKSQNKQPAAASVSTDQPKASETPKQTETPKATKQPEPAAAPKETPKNKETISKAEFDQIENGMTYEQVKGIIGGTGEVLSEVGTKGAQYYTVMYSYKGEGSLGANANFTFQDGKLQAKAQMGLA